MNKQEAIDKPIVPQFVADWYEDNKDNFEWNVYNLCVKFHEYELEGKIKEWFNKMDNKPIQTLINMHQFGYEVEKEKLYTVEIPNPNSSTKTKVYLAKNKDSKVELFSWTGYPLIIASNGWKKEKNAQLTEEEIKEDFDWAWQFAEEVNNEKHFKEFKDNDYQGSAVEFAEN